ncbi:MAG: alpha/beta fold hydrolase [Actinobacteria bacterium]|nr:alpha/beta fold hydrolase [Actinomycetota bacterium]
MPGGEVAASMASLPLRFRADAADGIKCRFRVKADRTVRDVVIDGASCRVESAHGRADSEICTDATTWLAMEAGRVSGMEAFAAGRLVVRGSIQSALLFEPLFERPDMGALQHSVERVKVGRLRISTLVTGPKNGDPLILIHGLGATKASWLTIVPQLATRFRIYAIDLPGFGSSSKPMGRYDARWFARHVFDLMDALGLKTSRLAGNSMGGRIVQEMAMMDPKRIPALACLCPATAFSERPGLWLAKSLRPELGVAARYMPRARVLSSMRDMFAAESKVDSAWYEAACDDFLRTWRRPRARMAFFAAARQIYLEEPHGEKGFWARLEAMQPPALYIYGKHDPLISADFGESVERFLPSAKVEVWEDCGHVPQVEYPERTAARLIDFFETATAASSRKRPPARRSAAR